ncbi:CHAT domain-containing protein [Nonomuraea sp. NPDC049421]|uniref:CHAT domain-containing protein n=1 Tax=Nonomuraea sp. NPDC049421 TaxID=3155275 RepID=UPI00342B1A39
MTDPAGALAARIERFEQAADPELIWDPAALSEAEQAMLACSGGRSDAATWRLIGMLHLARYRLDPRTTRDAAVAGAFFAAVAVVDPGRLPEKLRGSQLPPGESAGTWAGLVEEVFRHVDPGAYRHVGLLIHALVRRAMAEPVAEVSERLGEFLLQESVRSSDPSWAPGALGPLGAGLVRLHEATGGREIIDDAVHMLLRAALGEPAYTRDLAAALALAAPGDDELAAAYLAAAESGERDRSRALLALVELTRSRSVASWADDDLLAFIRVGQCALDSWHERWAHPGVLAPYASGLIEWYVVTGDERSLEAGLEMLDALRVTPDEDVRDLPDPLVRLRLLGDRRMRRHEVSGDPADLESAVEARRDALALVPDGHPAKPALLTASATALLELAALTDGDPAVPIAAARAALSAYGDHAPQRPDTLLLLAEALTLHLTTGPAPHGIPHPADEAVSVLREALAAGEGLTRRAEAYGLMSEVLRRRASSADGDRRAADLREAVQAARQAVELATKDAHGQAGARRALVKALLARHMAYQDPRDLTEALSLTGEPVGLDSTLDSTLDTALDAALARVLDGAGEVDEQLAATATELALRSPREERALTLLQVAERRAEGEAERGEFLAEAAERLAEAGRAGVAGRVLERAAEAFEAAGERSRAAAVLSRLGGLAEPGQALAAYARAADVHHDLGDPRAEAQELTRMGLLHLAAGEPARAADLHRRAATLCEEAGLPADEASHLRHAAEAHLAAGDPAAAVECAGRARNLHLDVGEPVRAALALVLAARAALDQDDLTAAGERITACAIELEAAGDWEEACRALDAHAVLLAVRGHPGQAAACETRLVEIVRRHGRRREPADEWYRIAQRRRGRGDAGGARVAFELAGREYDALGNPDGAASVRYNLGVLAYGEGESAQAMEAFGAAAEAFAQLDSPVKESLALTMRASCLTALGLPDDALTDLDHALETAGSDPYALLVATLGRAAVDVELGRLGEAEERLHTALTLAADDQLAEGVVQDRLAALHGRTGNLNAQVTALEAALSAFHTTGHPQPAALTAIKLGLALEHRGDYRAARQSLETALTLLQPHLPPPAETSTAASPGTSGGSASTQAQGPDGGPAGAQKPVSGPAATRTEGPAAGSADLGTVTSAGTRTEGPGGAPAEGPARGSAGGPAGDSAAEPVEEAPFELIAAMNSDIDAAALSRLATLHLTLGDLTRGRAALTSLRAGGRWSDAVARLEFWLQLAEAEAAGDLAQARTLAAQALTAPTPSPPTDTAPAPGTPALGTAAPDASTRGRDSEGGEPLAGLEAGDRSYLLVKLSGYCRALGDLPAAYAYAARGWESRDERVGEHLRNLGAAALELGRAEEAITHLEAAVEEARGAVPAQLAGALALLGAAYTDAARWREAGAAYEEGLGLTAPSVWRFLRIPLLVGRAALHLKLGELDEAAARYRDAIALGEELGRAAGRPADLAAAYADLALVHELRGDLEGARPLAERALHLQRAHGDARGTVLALVALARPTVEQTGRIQAVRWLEEAVALAQESGFRAGEAVAQCRLAVLDLGSGAYDRAGHRLSTAIGALTDLGHDIELRTAYHLRSVAAEELGDLAGALADAERACALGHAPSRERAVHLAVTLGRGGTAWEHAEQARVAALAAHLDDRPWPAPEGVPANLVEAEQQALTTVQTLMTAAGHTRDPDRAARLIHRARAARTDLEAVWRRMAPSAPHHVSLRRRSTSAPGTRGTVAMLAFHLDESVGTTTVLAHRTGWPEPRACTTTVGRELLTDFLHTTYAPRPGLLDIDARRHRADVWRRVADGLLTEALRNLDLQSGDLLHLLPGPGLHGIPLHALTPSGGRSLVEHGPVTYAPATTTEGRPQARRGTPLVIGQEEEAAALLGTTPVTATAADLRGVRPVLHLATGMVLDEKDPFGSGVVLADGLLTARRLMTMNVAADLVMLTPHTPHTPHTATPGTGTAVAALGQAFLHAGARAVLLPLRPVAKEISRALVPDLIMRLRAGDAPATALRAAVLGLRELYGSAEPDLWASYVLIGPPGGSPVHFDPGMRVTSTR